MDGEQLTDFAAVGASAGDGIFRLGRTSAILLLLFDLKKIIFFVGRGGGIGVANSLNLLKRDFRPVNATCSISMARFPFYAIFSSPYKTPEKVVG